MSKELLKKILRLVYELSKKLAKAWLWLKFRKYILYAAIGFVVMVFLFAVAVVL